MVADLSDVIDYDVGTTNGWFISNNRLFVCSSTHSREVLEAHGLFI